MIRVVALCALAAAALAAQRPDEFPDTWLEGTIGRGLRVHMYIGEAGWPMDHGLWGMYFYDSRWEPLPLEGARLPSGDLELFEGDPGRDAEPRARFRLHPGGSVTGTWTSADGARTLTVNLARTRKPDPYDVAIRRPRRFIDPRWPFSFAYPDGWLVRAGETRLLVRSPDPEDMIFDTELACERGHGVPPAPRADAPPQLFRDTTFYRTPNGWVTSRGGMQDCAEPGTRCDPATSRTTGGLTVLSAEVGYRAYNAWGYAGEADRSDYLILRGDEWATCVNRLFPSDGSWIEPAAAGRR
jgi:hypothetical protein